MLLIKAGYKVDINKKTKELEEIYVLVASPLGISEIPIDVYIENFVNSEEEFIELDKEVNEVLAETAFRQTIMELKEENDPIAELIERLLNKQKMGV